MYKNDTVCVHPTRCPKAVYGALAAWTALSPARCARRTRMPQVQPVEPEGTYLPWVNFSSLGLRVPELDRLIIERAKLWLDGGTIFGASGAGFQRFNIATPRAILQQALSRLEDAFQQK